MAAIGNAGIFAIAFLTCAACHDAMAVCLAFGLITIIIGAALKLTSLFCR